MKETRCNGFTLAEVLITLAIIGVVAAMTIPTLMQKFQYHTYVARLQETITVLSNLFTGRMAADGVEDLSDTVLFSIIPKDRECDTTYASSLNSAQCKLFFQELKKYLKYEYVEDEIPNKILLKYADNSGKISLSANSAPVILRLINGTELLYINFNHYVWYNSNRLSVKSRGGNVYSTPVQGGGSQQKYYGFIVDVTGINKGPNVFGRDIFYLNVGQDGKVYPFLSDDMIIFQDIVNYVDPPNESTIDWYKEMGWYGATQIIKDGWKMNY